MERDERPQCTRDSRKGAKDKVQGETTVDPKSSLNMSATGQGKGSSDKGTSEHIIREGSIIEKVDNPLTPGFYNCFFCCSKEKAKELEINPRFKTVKQIYRKGTFQDGNCVNY